MLTQILIIKILLPSIFLCVCTGAPTKEQTAVRSPYTKEEEQFIIAQLLEHSGATIPIHGKTIWIKIAEKIKLRRPSDPIAFPSDRTPLGLRLHFGRMLRSERIKQLPESLIQRLPPQKRRKRNYEELNVTAEKFPGKQKNNFVFEGYTSEEDKFIITKVLCYPISPVPIYGLNMWFALADDLKNYHRMNPTDFPKERSAQSLQGRFTYIMKTKLSAASRKKLMNKIRTPAGKDTSTSRAKKRDWYSQPEHDFVVEELLQPYFSSLSDPSMWEEMAVKHDEKRLSGTPGFVYERDARSLRTHFIRHVLKVGPVPPAVMKKFSEELTDPGVASQYAFSSQGEPMDIDEIIEDSAESWASMLKELETSSVVLQAEDNMATVSLQCEVYIDFSRMGTH